MDIYKNIEKYNPNKKPKILIVLDGMVADMLSNIKLNPVGTEGSELNISLAFITQSYFHVPKKQNKNRSNSTHYLLWKFQINVNFKKLHLIVALNHSLDIHFKHFMNLYKKCTAKPYSFLVIDPTLASDNPSRFRKNLREGIKKLIMTNDDEIRDEKLQYDINREAAKISALSSGEIDNYEYITGEEILPSDQRRMIEQAKFTYSALGKALEKQTKTIEDEGENQMKALQKHRKQLIMSSGEKDSLELLKQK